MDTMGITDPSSQNPVLNQRHFVRANFHVVILAVFSILFFFTGSVFSDTEIEPYFSIKGTVAEEEDELIRESGFITTITPGISVFREGPRSLLDLRYKLDAVFYGGFDESNDELVNTLDFLTNYQHVPGKWISTFQANSRLTNIDPTGRQNLDPEFIDDNNAELRTLGIDTLVKDELSNSVDYGALLFANYATYADSDDGDDTSGQGLLLELNNFRSAADLIWRTEFTSGLAEDGTDETQIGAFNAVIGYRVSPNWNPFISYTRTELESTDTPEFTDNKTLIGMLWLSNRRNFIAIGAGQRSGDNTYALDASLIRRHLTFTASYSDDITIARAGAFNYLWEDSLTILLNRDSGDSGISRNDISRVESSSQSTSITPIREKIARVDVTANGKRSLYRLSIFERDRTESTTDPDEDITGLQFDYGYTLSERDNVTVTALAQNTKTIETSDFWNLRANYSRQLARFETVDFGFGWTEQTSTEVADEYKRVFVSANYRVTF